MLTLIDLGAEFWRNYYGSGSNVTAYDLTLERVDWYRKDSPRTVVCCDSPKSLRKEYFPDYKSTRKPKPADAIDSLIGVEQRIRAWNTPIVSCDGYEADDLIATLVKQAWPEEVRIIGGEKDFYCLISDSVRLIAKGGTIGVAECVEKYGVLPRQMPDWLALVGDVADAIPGCPDCGPGRATTLLERFETIAGIQAATDDAITQLKGIGKKTLASFRAWDPTMAQRLVKLLDDAPLELDRLWATAA